MMKYIFEIRIKQGFSAEEYAEAWVRASTLIQQSPGAMGTELHQNISDPNRLIAIACWRSKEDRDAMQAQHLAEIDTIIHSVAPFVEIRSLGEFEDPQWTVNIESDAS
ncbi:antibiotic biosynthesis monooxygenase family protein [Microbulbifer spongiae]|uniref:Antibiotic biosynthesis monooxygenase n=1 Tax=Microbulbifer spongiae TaxID=2944933 RepID=A0ABY9ECR4_9GAMM|nr:antibiotic biosynthesis monooxygenase [Microbulbifer sp. MI-G]WKD49756.1 antibiotic biosynthesis monooxygenase [Microbulbifer sp. MI-G]